MRSIRKILSALLALSMTASICSPKGINAHAETIYQEESKVITDDIRSGGEFYVAASNINISEGSGARYAAVIKRGGNDLEAASVRLTLVDITARFVKDYTVEVPDKGLFERDVENASGAGSLMDEFEANDGRLDEINGVDDIANLYPESDNAAISEIKGITAVIEDDEDWSEPEVEFTEGVYYPKDGFANITIARDGVLTGVSAVKLTTSDGTAVEERDYSNAVSMGDIKTAAADSSAPYACAFTAVDMQGVASGNVALIDDNLTFMTATVMNKGSKYTDSDGKEITHLDDNIDTMTDREVYIQLYDFEEHKTYKPIRITDNSVEDTSPQLIFDNGYAYLFWRGEEGYSGDMIIMEFSDVYDAGEEPAVVLQVSVPSVKAGETVKGVSYMDIAPEGYFKYGRLNAAAELFE